MNGRFYPVNGLNNPIYPISKAGIYRLNQTEHCLQGHRTDSFTIRYKKLVFFSKKALRQLANDQQLQGLNYLEYRYKSGVIPSYSTVLEK